MTYLASGLVGSGPAAGQPTLLRRRKVGAPARCRASRLPSPHRSGDGGDHPGGCRSCHVVVGVGVLTLAVAILAGRPGRRTCGRRRRVPWRRRRRRSAARPRHLGRRGDIPFWAVGDLALIGCMIGLTIITVRDPATSPTLPVGRLWALGPFLALGAMMLANPAFAASQSGTPLALAGPLNAAGLLLAGWLSAAHLASPFPGSGGQPRLGAVACVRGHVPKRPRRTTSTAASGPLISTDAACWRPNR